jgi:hypothetical protein
MPSRRPLTELLTLCSLLSLATLAGAVEPPLRSRADLDAWLTAHVGQSPLDALSPGARERFLYSLRFGTQGIVGADGGDLADELTDPQIFAVLALFGPEATQQVPGSRRDQVQTLERNVRHRDAIGEMERHYNDYYKAVRDIDEPETEVRRRRIAETFATHLAGLYTTRSLARADDRDLRLLRRAAEEVALGTREAPHVDAFRAVFAEREKRKLVSTGDLETLQSLFVSLHRLADARRLRDQYRHFGLPPLPTFRDPLEGGTGTTAWRMDADGKRLTREVVPLEGTWIVVTASCHLSRDALRDIKADAELAPVFARHAMWLSEAPGVESFEAARDWNREFPEAPILMIYDRAEWRLLPRWRMPEFYVVRDGAVVDSVSGWRRGEPAHREALVSLLQRNGLLPD